MAVTDESTASPARGDLFDVFVGMLSEVDADREAPPSNAFHDRLCEAVCKLTAMQRAVLFLYDPADQRVELVGAHGLDRARLGDLDVTLDDAPMARRALAEDSVVVVDEGIEDEITAAYAGLFGVATLTCTPLAAGGRWLGVLFADRGGGHFDLTDDERHAMWTLGKTAALASSAWLVTREQEHARRLSDRLDFAREIHDRVIQRLFGVSLVLGADGALSASARKRCRDELHAALTELRSALRRPLEMERPRVDGSLREALERAANGGQHAFGYDWQPGLSIPRPLERLARAVLAEALRNATKHAHPTAIAAKVAGEDGELVLTVRNDGVAPRRSRPDTGLGLRLVALEAIAHGGQVDAGPVVPRRLGTAVLRTPAGGDMSESLRILVVDDHDVVHWGFRLLLSEQPWVQRCFSARDGDAAVALARRHRPDVALVDLFTGDQSGIDICASVLEASPDTSVLLISGAGQVSDQTARRAGAAGFVSKDLDAADVVKAVRMVALGMTVFTPGSEPAPLGLSPREREVLDLIAEGATNRQIGDRLFLSPHTVKEHSSALYRKLGVRNRAEAVQQAQRRGLLV